MTEITQDLALVGLRFRWNKELRGEIATLLNRKPLAVEIVREAENEYDPNALAVVAPDGSFKLTDAKKGLRTGGHLGYIRADSAAILAPLVDDGSVEIRSATLYELSAPDYNDGQMTLAIFKNG